MVTFNCVNLLVGVVSLSLAAFSIWLSIKFYRWSSETESKISDILTEMSIKINFLDKWIDKMFEIIESQHKAMQKKLYGTVGSAQKAKKVDNSEIDIYSHIKSKRLVSLQELSKKYNISKDKVQAIVSKLEKNGDININEDGEAVYIGKEDSTVEQVG